MPPEGYDTLTLPTELVDSIDDVGHMDRVATLRLLLSEYNDSGIDERALAQEVTDLVAGGEIRIDPEAIADAVAERVDGGDTVDARIVDMDASERRKFAEEVAGVLQG